MADFQISASCFLQSIVEQNIFQSVWIPLHRKIMKDFHLEKSVWNAWAVKPQLQTGRRQRMCLLSSLSDLETEGNIFISSHCPAQRCWSFQCGSAICFPNTWFTRYWKRVWAEKESWCWETPSELLTDEFKIPAEGSDLTTCKNSFLVDAGSSWTVVY